MKIRQKLREIARQFPPLPGCYLMKNTQDQVIYVGKAKHLRKRVSSYFNNSTNPPKTEILVGHVRQVEFIITENEAAALVLENNLIKKYRPRYNIDLKDDKSYPYVVVANEQFPRLQYLRRPKRNPGDQVFGPFVTGSHASEIVHILTRSFQLRDCSPRDFQSRTTPCLLHQMQQCSAPCVGKISPQDYQKDLAGALDFFHSKGSNSLKMLKQRMLTASQQEAFERAALIRNAIEKLQQFVDFQQENSEVHRGVKNADYISYHAGKWEVDISIYLLRHRMILGYKNFNFPLVDIIDELPQVLLSCLLQYYSTTQESPPQQLVVDLNKAQCALLGQALQTVLGPQIKVRTPTPKTQGIIQLTQQHAQQSQKLRVTNQQSVYSGLNKLAELLGMDERPRVMECFDVAVFQGKSPTAAQVVFVDGRPDKSRYRHYKLQERPEGNNDFAMMRELFERRLDNGNLPEVFIVDGGVAQVNTVSKVLEEFQLTIPVAGIAKAKNLSTAMRFAAKEPSKSQERLVIPNNRRPYVLAKNPPLLRVLVQMRDEAHRFARKLHHKYEQKRVIHSWIDQVPGVGREIKKDILRSVVHSQEQLAEMNLGQLSRALGISLPVARRVKKFLHGKGAMG